MRAPLATGSGVDSGPRTASVASAVAGTLRLMGDQDAENLAGPAASVEPLSGPVARERVRTVLAVLRTAVGNPDLRRLGFSYALCCTAELGIWIALLIYAYVHGGTAAGATIVLVQLVPCIVVGPFLGAVADVRDPQRVLDHRHGGAGRQHGSGCRRNGMGCTRVGRLHVGADDGVEHHAHPADASSAVPRRRPYARRADGGQRDEWVDVRRRLPRRAGAGRRLIVLGGTALAVAGCAASLAWP